MGVDDHEFAQVVDLTTVRQPVADHGSTAARMLVDNMNREGRGAVPDEPAALESCEVQPDVELVVRSTTGPPRADRWNRFRST